MTQECYHHQLSILMSPNPNIRITLVGGNTYSFTFSFADYLEMCLKFVLHLDGMLLGKY